MMLKLINMPPLKPGGIGGSVSLGSRAYICMTCRKLSYLRLRGRSAYIKDSSVQIAPHPAELDRRVHYCPECKAINNLALICAYGGCLAAAEWVFPVMTTASMFSPIVAGPGRVKDSIALAHLCDGCLRKKVFPAHPEIVEAIEQQFYYMPEKADEIGE